MKSKIAKLGDIEVIKTYKKEKKYQDEMEKTGMLGEIFFIKLFLKPFLIIISLELQNIKLAIV